jgi:predicted thioesterase
MTDSGGPVLRHSQTTLMYETLRVALRQTATGEGSVARAAHLLPPDPAASEPPHPSLPTAGSTTTRVLTVAPEDTAAAMGHPDRSVQVLGSPRIALWFELVASEALPAPDVAQSHVGVGILVHHLGRAEVGQDVTVSTTVEAAFGRRILFTCLAVVGPRIVALGVHQRLVRS